MANAPPGTFDGNPYQAGTPQPDPNFQSPYTSPVAAGAPADAAHVLNYLVEYQWRGIGFPTESFTIELRQDLAIHKMTDRDGAYIEGTGRSPLQFSARIPFINGLTAGMNESWGGTNLYPSQWRSFFAACADRSTGVLQHPELGPITCKLESCHTEWSGHSLGGVWVNAVWLETDDSDINQVTAALASPSPAGQVASASADLDNDVPNVIGPSLPTFPFSFSDLAFAIRGVIDTPSLMAKELGGRIDNILYQANTIVQALKGYSDAAQTLNPNGGVGNTSALNWPIYDACMQVQSAAYDLKSLQLTSGKPVSFYRVTVDQPLFSVAQNIPAPLDDIFTLNPTLISQAIILSGTKVRYYT
jgi:hypothetical protein